MLIFDLCNQTTECTTGGKIRHFQKHAGLRRLQGGADRRHHYPAGTKLRGATRAAGVSLRRRLAETEGGETRLLAVHRRRQVRNPISAEILRGTNAGILKLLERPRRPRNLRHLLQPVPQGDGLELHRQEHGGCGFLLQV